MVVQPCVPHSPSSTSATSPAWTAIEALQRRRADAYLLITQPDHAVLSGDLAAHFISPAYPSLSNEAIQAIAAHDAGWRHFAGEYPDTTPALTAEGKPRSFIEFSPIDFTRAWSASIDHAASQSAFGGILVSRHFTSLGEFALRRFEGCARETDALATFLRDEELRQRSLARDCACSDSDVENGLKALQFCDLLSLALCCNIREPIQFPQSFGGTQVTMHYEDGFFILTPSPFQSSGDNRREISLSVPAQQHPNAERTEIAFRLQ